MKVRYAVVIERIETGYSAYVPDLPGCVATGSTIDETAQEIRDAIEFHIDGLQLAGEPVPAPSSTTREVEAAVST